jgi:Domain of unknown function (DUF4933)
MKKNFSIAILIFLMLLIIISCHHNRLKMDEKELAKEILVQEKTKKDAEKTANEKESSQTRTRTTGSFRKKEIRSVDPQSPPVKIDIMGSANNTRKLKLSDVASSIRYVKLQTPSDTLLLYDLFFYRPDLDSKVRSDGQQIIFEGLFGLTRYNMQGEYQETIWKNNTGIRFYGKGMASYGGKDFFGVPFHIPVSFLNGNLYYSFHDGPTGNDQVMKYKPGTDKKLTIQAQSEIPGHSIIPGDTLFNTNQFSEDRFSWIYGIGPDSWAGVNNKWNAGTTGSLIVTFSNSGDTICQFTDYDRIVNYSFGEGRNAVDLKSYYYNGLLTIKQEYNDTIFRLIPPERLLPVYILNFGIYKFSFMDGFNPNFDLSDKFMLNSIYETNSLLFIRYTKNYDCLNTRKKNGVKFYNALFNKKEGKLYHQPGFTPLPEGLENDLDGGMSFWPEFITPQGEMMKLVSGRVLKDYINSDEFRKSSISEEKKQKQLSMAIGLRPTDMVVVIVK